MVLAVMVVLVVVTNFGHDTLYKLHYLVRRTDLVSEGRMMRIAAPLAAATHAANLLKEPQHITIN